MSKSYWGKQYLVRKLEAIEYKGGKCKICGYKRYHGALEFHHRDPSQKEFDWSKLRKRSLKSIKKELDKCDLLCSNCHKEAHKKDGHLEEVMEWREQVVNKVLKTKICPFCKIKFKPYAGKLKFCSMACSLKSKEKIKWPTNLKELVDRSSKKSIAKQLGVSDKAVAKRLLKYHTI